MHDGQGREPLVARHPHSPRPVAEREARMQGGNASGPPDPADGAPASRQGTRRAVRWRAAAVLLLVAGVTYNDWLLQLWVHTGLDQRNSYVSEAFASDQPHQMLFSAVELLTAAMVLAAACLVIPVLPWSWAAAGWAALVLFAACSVADVVLPMRCAPSREAGCPTANVAHTVTSGLVHFAVFASMTALAVHARSATGQRCRAGRWARRLLPVSMTAAILSAGPYVGFFGGQGIAQRIHLVTVGVWMWWLAAEAARAGRPMRPAPPLTARTNAERGAATGPTDTSSPRVPSCQDSTPDDRSGARSCARGAFHPGHQCPGRAGGFADCPGPL
ncbi:DUF998 domain-containing protein [Streptomyces sp. NPDC046161]|uniref:DUF998 domain-containing protein n=1 Tax=Streptomyces sp. NPDC046161 TaxID=3155132 RepID=UPI00340C8C60